MHERINKQLLLKYGCLDSSLDVIVSYQLSDYIAFSILKNKSTFFHDSFFFIVNEVQCIYIFSSVQLALCVPYIYRGEIKFLLTSITFFISNNCTKLPVSGSRGRKIPANRRLDRERRLYKKEDERNNQFVTVHGFQWIQHGFTSS